MEPTVVVSHVSKSFGETKAVEDVSFEVFPGEVFGLLGPNGAGKTTTIRIMLDIFKADSGSVSILGGPLNQARLDRIGYLPEERGLYRDQRLDTTLVYLATLKGMRQDDAREKLTGWLRRMDLLEHRGKKVQELSKGMQQKAQIIASMLHEPEVLVIDEPFTGLDPVNTRLVKDMIEEQRRAGCTVIMSTHQMYQVEALCSRIALINSGRTVLYGDVEGIRRSFAGNAISVVGQGDFEGLPGVLDLRQQDGEWRMSLATGASPQDVLHALTAREGVRIERFEIAEPSLDDIFIKVVTEGGEYVDEGTVAQLRGLAGPEPPGPGGLVFETTTGRVETATGGLLRLIFPAAVALFFVVAVMASAGYLLQAVTEEKENRTMEIMTTSLSAEQLVVGKSVGLIAVSLTQVVIWLLVGALALAAAAQAIPVLKDVQVPWGFVGIAVLFFLPSFVLEAGIITSVGAAVTDLRQGQQITGVLQLFFWLPFFFIGLIIGSPDNPVLVALSLFPLTSLSTIALRWGATVIPWWQIVVAWLLVAGSAVGMLLVAPRIFRRGMLRYGQHMKLGGLMEAVRSRNA